jgi:hypothetical protein
LSGRKRNKSKPQETETEKRKITEKKSQKMPVTQLRKESLPDDEFESPALVGVVVRVELDVDLVGRHEEGWIATSAWHVRAGGGGRREIQK